MGKKVDRITIDPELMNGQPFIRNMRLTVRRVVEAVALYPDTGRNCGKSTLNWKRKTFVKLWNSPQPI